jgi:hypothetical protein
VYLNYIIIRFSYKMGQCVSQEPMFPHRQAILAPACNASVSDTSHDNHSHAEFRYAIIF